MTKVINPSTHQKLVNLIHTPGLLTEPVQQELLNSLHTISEFKSQNLLKILSEGKQKLQKTDQNFDQKELPLKQKMLQELANFQQYGVITAIHQAELNNQSNDNKNLQNISNQLNEI